MSKLYPCVYCTEDGYCKKYSDEKVISWCVQGPCKDEKPSHADSIRSMSDEELAEFINGVEAEAIRRTGLFITVGDIQRGKECWLDWLKREADNE